MSKNFNNNNDRINGSKGGHSNSERMSIGKFVNGNNRVIIRHERQDEQRQVFYQVLNLISRNLHTICKDGLTKKE